MDQSNLITISLIIPSCETSHSKKNIAIAKNGFHETAEYDQMKCRLDVGASNAG